MPQPTPCTSVQATGKRVAVERPITTARIPKCCPAMSALVVLPSVLLHDDQRPEHGYALESSNCECDSRWLPFDWRKGHASFTSH